MVRRFGIALPALVVLSCLATAARAEPPSVRVEATMHDGRTRYLAGEAIVVDLVLTAVDEPVAIDRATDESLMSIDQVRIEPADGVYPWRADSERFVPRWGDTFVIPQPAREFRTSVVLNRRFRFDAEGTYTVRVETSRVKPAVTSNPVTFTVSRASPDDEKRRATALGEALRNAPDERTAGRLATQLDWLADDAATDVKLDLLVGPRKSDCYFRHDRIGLWVAHDRRRVIERLERAIVDPAEDIPMGSGLLSTLVALSVAERMPLTTDANVPLAPRRGNVWVPGPLAKETGDAYARAIHAIAQSLPSRTGASRIDAAQRVMWSKDRRAALMDDAEFVAARDAVIDHFEDVSPYTVDTDLGSYGRFLEDPRMIPKLKALLEAPGFATFASGRGDALTLLAKLDPASTADYVVHEACAVQPAILSSIRDLPLVSAPRADDCLATRIDEQSSPDAPRATQTRLDFSTLPYVARFASDRLLPKVAAIYPSLTASPHTGEGAAAALVFLMRWDPVRYRPLLDAAADDPRNLSLTFQMTALASPPTDGIRAFFRDRIAASPTAMTQNYIYALGQIGEAEDLRFLQQRLDWIRASPSTLPGDVAKQEKPIEQAIGRGGATKPRASI